MAFDASGNLWMSNGSATSATTSNEVVQLSNINNSACIGGSVTYPCLLTTSLTQNTFTAYNQGSMLAPWGVAAGTNTMWVANAGAGSNSLTNLSLTGSTVNSGTNYGSTTSFNSPHYIAVDGAGNLWAANKNVSPGTVSELSSAGTVLSAVPIAPAVTPTGFSHAGLSTAQGVAIDASGNVWVANNVASGTDANSVFEIVGSAAPTVTPIALALKNNAVAQKP
jgi:secreted PhoX family phosphatase